jgi:hypothetical protein
MASTPYGRGGRKKYVYLMLADNSACRVCPCGRDVSLVHRPHRHPLPHLNDSPNRSSTFLSLPPLPRRDGCRIDPQPFLGLSRVLLQPFQHRIPRRILPIPPAPTVFDQRVIDVGAIGRSISAGAHPYHPTHYVCNVWLESGGGRALHRQTGHPLLRAEFPLADEPASQGTARVDPRSLDVAI